MYGRQIREGMPEMHTKGFFFNSSFRKSRALKALLRGHGQPKEGSESSGESAGGAARAPFDPKESGPPMRDYRDQIKKAVC